MIEKIREKLGLDEKDQIIMDSLGENPNLSQHELSKLTKISQPAVGMRILNLKKKGILSHNIGIDFKKVDLFLGKVEVTAKEPKKIIDEFKCCPYFLNALIMSGEYNLCLFFMAPDLKLLDAIVSNHLRTKDSVTNISFNLMIEANKSFIFSAGYVNQKGCDNNFCKGNCSSFKISKSEIQNSTS